MSLPLPEVMTDEFIQYLRGIYRLNWFGLHGWDHWVRVYENGMHIAAQNGADQTVVAVFAFTHDIDRQNEGGDHGHGPRAAQRIAAEMQGRFFSLQDDQLHQVMEAARLHTAGKTEADKTVQTCWDADRLDLWRAWIRPNAKYLCTPEARDPHTIDWAVRRSQQWLSERGT
jgi:uncharacterized protein